MNIKFDLDYPKQFPWLKPLIDREFAATLRKAARGQYEQIGKFYALEDAIVTGETFKSFTISEVAKLGDRMEIEIAPRGDRAQIASYIEFGRGPGHIGPNFFAAIKTWLYDRGIVPRGETGSKVDALAWAIMKTIAENGIEPRLILEKAERRYRPSIVRMFEAATRRLAKQINAKITLEHN